MVVSSTCPRSINSRCSGTIWRRISICLSSSHCLSFFAPATSLFAELGQLAVFFEHQRMEPRQVAPALQIDDVLLAEPLARPLNWIDLPATLLEQLVVAPVRPDHLVRMDHEEVVQEVVRVVFRQAVGRQAGNAQVGVLVAVIGVGRQLRQQTGHEVDRGVHLGHFAEQHRHSPVVLGSVQPDPRHGVFTGNVVGIVRLMLVPEKGQTRLRA